MRPNAFARDKAEVNRISNLTQVGKAVQGTLGCCHQYETPPWWGSGIDEPAAAASSPDSAPPAGG